VSRRFEPLDDELPGPRAHPGTGKTEVGTHCLVC
jgi:hypothetical protein